MFREAQRLQRLDQVPEAIAAYQRALLDWPEHANSWFNLGLLFRQARRPDEALVCYQRALNLGIANPQEVHLNRGVIYADYLRQDAEAERELRTALDLQPSFVPALLNLANIQEDRGRRDEALELFDRFGRRLIRRWRDHLGRGFFLVAAEEEPESDRGEVERQDRRRHLVAGVGPGHAVQGLGEISSSHGWPSSGTLGKETPR
jgi:tetratricopeptide (TPR) repeat protein